jgi:hypothetical protein
MKLLEVKVDLEVQEFKNKTLTLNKFKLID